VETWVGLLLPFTLILARTTAFLAALPLFSTPSAPRMLKAGLALLLTVFFGHFAPPAGVAAGGARLLAASVLLAREALCGLALGLAARMIYTAVQQGGILIARQMGFYMASIVDPSTDQETEPLGLYFDVLFMLLFLAAGGHHLLLRLVARSFQVMPLAGEFDFGALAAGVLAAGSAMLLFSLKLAAPMLAAFLVLGVVLGVLARVLPEMNVLLTSLPLRVAAGLGLAVAIIPSLEAFTEEIAHWMNRLL